MNEMLEKRYAEVVPASEQETDSKVWYVPHHGVYHPKKSKIRVVFDCSAEHRGVSLNSQLLQGPDVGNSLIGVLIRFRKEVVGLSCDIQGTRKTRTCFASCGGSKEIPQPTQKSTG